MYLQAADGGRRTADSGRRAAGGEQRAAHRFLLAVLRRHIDLRLQVEDTGAPIWATNENYIHLRVVGTDLVFIVRVLHWYELEALRSPSPSPSGSDSG